MRPLESKPVTAKDFHKHPNDGMLVAKAAPKTAATLDSTPTVNFLTYRDRQQQQQQQQAQQTAKGNQQPQQQQPQPLVSGTLFFKDVKQAAETHGGRESKFADDLSVTKKVCEGPPQQGTGGSTLQKPRSFVPGELSCCLLPRSTYPPWFGRRLQIMSDYE